MALFYGRRWVCTGWGFEMVRSHEAISSTFSNHPTRDLATAKARQDLSSVVIAAECHRDAGYGGPWLATGATVKAAAVQHAVALVRAFVCRLHRAGLGAVRGTLCVLRVLAVGLLLGSPQGHFSSPLERVVCGTRHH